MFSDLRHSGGEVMMRVASDLWAEHGVVCEIVAVADVVGPYAHTLEEAGYRIHRLSPLVPRLLTSFPRLLRAVKPDVVHLHIERANFWLALQALGSGARVVQTVHFCFPFSGALRMERTIQRRVLSKLGVDYVAVGPSVALNEWRIFHNPTEIIWIWCDLETFSPATSADRDAARGALGLHGDDQVLVSVGNCALVKNHESILRAMATASMPSNVVYLHVGDDSSKAGVDERRLAATLGLGDRVRFLGTAEDVRRVLHAADLFVMPSHIRGNEHLDHRGTCYRNSHARDSGSRATRCCGDEWRYRHRRIRACRFIRGDCGLPGSQRPRPTIKEPTCDGRAVVLSREGRSPVRRPLPLICSRERRLVCAGRTGDDRALLTCHNRRKHTLECLESLRATAIPGVTAKVHLVDDGSNDGTAEAVAAAYPDVQINRGSGDLFWGGGMRLAFTRAVPARPDYVLWLNDDVVLDPDALERLLTTYASLCAERRPLSVVVGSTRDPQTGVTTYGGVRRTSRLRRMAFSLVTPTDTPQACDTMNGNVVLIPRSVYSVVGNMDQSFTHGGGDTDYGLRLARPGARYSSLPATWAPAA